MNPAQNNNQVAGKSAFGSKAGMFNNNAGQGMNSSLFASNQPPSMVGINAMQGNPNQGLNKNRYNYSMPVKADGSIMVLGKVLKPAS